MTPSAKGQCKCAMVNIEVGDYLAAIDNLRRALKGTSDRRVWSKLMLAIRELSKISN